MVYVKVSLIAPVLVALIGPILGGIDIPRDGCSWQSGEYGQTTKCDGDQVSEDF